MELLIFYGLCARWLSVPATFFVWVCSKHLFLKLSGSLACKHSHLISGTRGVCDLSWKIPYWCPQNSGIASEWLLFSTSCIISVIIFVWDTMVDSVNHACREPFQSDAWILGRLIISMEFFSSNRSQFYQGTLEVTVFTSYMFSWSEV